MNHQGIKNTKKDILMLSQEQTIIEIRDERQLKALAGVTESQLEIIVSEQFNQVEKEANTARYEQSVLAGKRVRKLGGGNKGILNSSIQKVLFVLVYCKIYPTYDDLGSRFGMSKSAAFEYKSIFPNYKKPWQIWEFCHIEPLTTFKNLKIFFLTLKKLLSM